MAAKDTDRVEVVADRPQERESPVRRAHAATARRHGRASTPGYLGLPIEDPPAEEQPDAPKEQAREDGAGGSRRGGSSKAGGGSRRRASSTGGRGGGQRTSSGRGGKKSSARGGSKPSGGGSSEGSDGSGGQEPEDSPLEDLAALVQDRMHDLADEAREIFGGGTGKAGRRVALRLARKAAGAGIKSAARTIANKANSSGSGTRGSGSGGDKRSRTSGRASGAAKQAGSRSQKPQQEQQGRDQGQEQEHSLGVPVRTLPIQQSVDIAVPIEVAWEQWMEFRHFPEGARRATGVSREGDELHGSLDGLVPRQWRAKIIDERRCESFAWRSLEGSDSAGLVTFHQLGERLTRIELNLDVRPDGLLEAAALALHLADRRVEAELRRLKADAELLNPDIYGELLGSRNGNGRSAKKGRAGGRR